MNLRLFLSACALVSLMTGCHATVGAVNPRPNVVVPSNSPKYSVDVSRVKDHVELDHVTIERFRTTLSRGFANAVGSKLSTPQAQDSVVLVLDGVEAELSNLGNLGRFLTLRFRGRWMTPDNQLIAEFAGVAQPRNPTETGNRHLEDVVEVMYEKVISGLNDTLRQAPAQNNAAPPPVRSGTPTSPVGNRSL